MPVGMSGDENLILLTSGKKWGNHIQLAAKNRQHSQMVKLSRAEWDTGSHFAPER
jgi:hypothetical protein